MTSTDRKWVAVFTSFLTALLMVLVMLFSGDHSSLSSVIDGIAIFVLLVICPLIIIIVGIISVTQWFTAEDSGENTKNEETQNAEEYRQREKKKADADAAAKSQQEEDAKCRVAEEERRKAEEQRESEKKQSEAAANARRKREEDAKRVADEDRRRAEEARRRSHDQTTHRGAKTEQQYASILGLKGKVTLADVKSRYRELANQYHPDKVSHLGEKLQSLAKEEMLKINEANDYFKKKYGV